MVDFASHAGSEVAQQVEAGAADILDRDVAAKRRIIFVPLHDVAEVPDAAGGQGLDRTGADAVYPYSFRTKVRSQIFDRSLQRGLCNAHHVVVRDYFFRT